MLHFCFRNQKLELQQRQSDGFYRAKAYDRMKYRIRDGPWVKYCSVMMVMSCCAVVSHISMFADKIISYIDISYFS